MSDLEDRVERLEAELGIEQEPEYRNISTYWFALTFDGSVIAYVPVADSSLKVTGDEYAPINISFNTSVVESDEWNEDRLYVSKIETVRSGDVPDDWMLRD